MDDRELVHVKAYHSRLVEISAREQILRESKPARQDSKGFFLFRMGRAFLSLGKRLPTASLNEIERPVDLKRESA